jgi:hypothetical protein
MKIDMLRTVNTPPVESNFQGDWNALCPHCNRPHKDHIDASLGIPDYVHRMPCPQEKQVMLNEQRRFVRTGKRIVSIWRGIQLLFLVAIPLAIEALGFANPIIGITLFVVVALKAIWLALDILGCSEKWFPSIGEKKRIERDKSFWYEQFQKHPDKFRYLLVRTEGSPNANENS